QCYSMARPAGSFHTLPACDYRCRGPATIRMCRDCRVDYYIEHSEYIPDIVAPYKVGEYTGAAQGLHNCSPPMQF
ncbi:hypothetical protein BGX29_003596, partial [Mortierella sp. GBA35]